MEEKPKEGHANITSKMRQKKRLLRSHGNDVNRLRGKENDPLKYEEEYKFLGQKASVA